MNLDIIEKQAIEGKLACPSWRQHKTNREETNAVKQALLEAGYLNVRVTHARGTAWGWLGIYCDPKPNQTWQEMRNKVLRIAKSVTGRHGEFDGEINVFDRGVK